MNSIADPMHPVPSLDVRSALILKADRLYAETLRRSVESLAPRAQIVVAHSVKAAAHALSRITFDLVIAGFDAALDGDVLQLIAEFALGPARQRGFFVVASQLEYRVLAALQTLPIRGVFDPATDSPLEFDAALRTVVRGQRYWSRSVAERAQRESDPKSSRCHHLSNTEQLVLSVLGDGSDDSTAAEALGLSPSTISTVRRKLHRKLRVQHRGELIRIAAQYGFVRFTPSGIMRPGFAMLAAECLSRKRKRRASAEAAMSAFLTVNEV